MIDPDGLSPERIEQIRHRWRCASAACYGTPRDVAFDLALRDIRNLLDHVTAQAATIAQLQEELVNIEALYAELAERQE